MLTKYIVSKCELICYINFFDSSPFHHFILSNGEYNIKIMKKISIVIPVYFEEKVIAITYSRLKEFISRFVMIMK